VQALALPASGAGAVALVTSVLSLRQWRQGRRTTPLTLTTAGE